VNVGAVYNVIRAQVVRDMDLLASNPQLTRSILGAPSNPDLVLESHKRFSSKKEIKKDTVKKEAKLRLA
jgi:DNA (cytosine-5)-methyltransferase 1